MEYWFYELMLPKENYVVMVYIDTIKSLWTIDIWSTNATTVTIFSVMPVEEKKSKVVITSYALTERLEFVW